MTTHLVEHCPHCGAHIVVTVDVSLMTAVLPGEGECVIPQVDYEAAVHKCQETTT